ncbi:MAG: MBL fold metallo-hydrolase [Oscillospiraceae bacterium]|nr:MBL fold metallo-hydrolase [Oscillospiraceae bacterium]
MKQLKNGCRIRWINTAGFEICMANGKHILIDPFLSGKASEQIVCYPIDLDRIDACDYLLLSHTHCDHAEDVGKIQRKFPKLNLFVGDLSADALCSEQDLDCSRLYRVRGGEVYEFDDLKIEAFTGRHTESSRGYRKSSRDFYRDGQFWPMQWYGTLEFINYRLTLCDGTVIFLWGGMTSPDQKYKFQNMKANIAIMQVSPKQSFSEFAELVHAVRAQVVIPHHYDFTEKLFEAMPFMMDAMSEENKKNYIIDGVFQWTSYMDALAMAVQEESPETDLLPLDHHRWYRFGFTCKVED